MARVDPTYSDDFVIAKGVETCGGYGLTLFLCQWLYLDNITKTTSLVVPLELQYPF